MLRQVTEAMRHPPSSCLRLLTFSVVLLTLLVPPANTRYLRSVTRQSRAHPSSSPATNKSQIPSVLVTSSPIFVSFSITPSSTQILSSAKASIRSNQPLPSISTLPSSTPRDPPQTSDDATNGPILPSNPNKGNTPYPPEAKSSSTVPSVSPLTDPSLSPKVTPSAQPAISASPKLKPSVSKPTKDTSPSADGGILPDVSPSSTTKGPSAQNSLSPSAAPSHEPTQSSLSGAQISPSPSKQRVQTPSQSASPSISLSPSSSPKPSQRLRPSASPRPVKQTGTVAPIFSSSSAPSPSPKLPPSVASGEPEPSNPGSIVEQKSVSPSVTPSPSSAERELPSSSPLQSKDAAKSPLSTSSAPQKSDELVISFTPNAERTVEPSLSSSPSASSSVVIPLPSPSVPEEANISPSPSPTIEKESEQPSPSSPQSSEIPAERSAKPSPSPERSRESTPSPSKLSPTKEPSPIPSMSPPRSPESSVSTSPSASDGPGSLEPLNSPEADDSGKPESRPPIATKSGIPSMGSATAVRSPSANAIESSPTREGPLAKASASISPTATLSPVASSLPSASQLPTNTGSPTMEVETDSSLDLPTASPITDSAPTAIGHVPNAESSISPDDVPSASAPANETVIASTSPKTKTPPPHSSIEADLHASMSTSAGVAPFSPGVSSTEFDTPSPEADTTKRESPSASPMPSSSGSSLPIFKSPSPEVNPSTTMDLLASSSQSPAAQSVPVISVSSADVIPSLEGEAPFKEESPAVNTVTPTASSSYLPERSGSAEPMPSASVRPSSLFEASPQESAPIKPESSMKTTPSQFVSPILSSEPSSSPIGGVSNAKETPFVPEFSSPEPGRTIAEEASAEESASPSKVPLLGPSSAVRESPSPESILLASERPSPSVNVSSDVFPVDASSYPSKMSPSSDTEPSQEPVPSSVLQKPSVLDASLTSSPSPIGNTIGVESMDPILATPEPSPTFMPIPSSSPHVPNVSDLASPTALFETSPTKEAETPVESILSSPSVIQPSRTPESLQGAAVSPSSVDGTTSAEESQTEEFSPSSNVAPSQTAANQSAGAEASATASPSPTIEAAQSLEAVPSLSATRVPDVSYTMALASVSFGAEHLQTPTSIPTEEAEPSSENSVMGADVPKPNSNPPGVEAETVQPSAESPSPSQEGFSPEESQAPRISSSPGISVPPVNESPSSEDSTTVIEASVTGSISPKASLSSEDTKPTLEVTPTFDKSPSHGVFASSEVSLSQEASPTKEFPPLPEESFSSGVTPSSIPAEPSTVPSESASGEYHSPDQTTFSSEEEATTAGESTSPELLPSARISPSQFPSQEFYPPPMSSEPSPLVAFSHGSVSHIQSPSQDMSQVPVGTPSSPTEGNSVTSASNVVEVSASPEGTQPLELASSFTPSFIWSVGSPTNPSLAARQSPSDEASTIPQESLGIEQSSFSVSPSFILSPTLEPSDSPAIKPSELPVPSFVFSPGIASPPSGTGTDSAETVEVSPNSVVNQELPGSSPLSQPAFPETSLNLPEPTLTPSIPTNSFVPMTSVSPSSTLSLRSPGISMPAITDLPSSTSIISPPVEEPLSSSSGLDSDPNEGSTSIPPSLASPALNGSPSPMQSLLFPNAGSNLRPASPSSKPTEDRFPEISMLFPSNADGSNVPSAGLASPSILPEDMPASTVSVDASPFVSVFPIGSPTPLISGDVSDNVGNSAPDTTAIPYLEESPSTSTNVVKSPEASPVSDEVVSTQLLVPSVSGASPEVSDEIRETVHVSPTSLGLPSVSAEAGMSPSPFFLTPIPSMNVGSITTSPLTGILSSPLSGATSEGSGELGGVVNASPTLGGMPSTSAEAGLSPSPLFTTPISSTSVGDTTTLPLSSGTFTSPILETTPEGSGEMGDAPIASPTFGKVPIISAEEGLSPSPLFTTPIPSANVGNMPSPSSSNEVLASPTLGPTSEVDEVGGIVTATPTFERTPSVHAEVDPSLSPSLPNTDTSLNNAFQTPSPAVDGALSSPNSEKTPEISNENGDAVHASPALDKTPGISVEAGLSPLPSFTPMVSFSAVDMPSSPSLSGMSSSPVSGTTPEMSVGVGESLNASPSFIGIPISTEAEPSPSPLFSSPIESLNSSTPTSLPSISQVSPSPLLGSTLEASGDVEDTAHISPTISRIPITSAEISLSSSPLISATNSDTNVGIETLSPAVTGTSSSSLSGSTPEVSGEFEGTIHASPTVQHPSMTIGVHVSPSPLIPPPAGSASGGIITPPPSASMLSSSSSTGTTPGVSDELGAIASASPTFDGVPSMSAEAGLSSPIFNTPAVPANVGEKTVLPSVSLMHPSSTLGSTPELIGEIGGTVNASPTFGVPSTAVEAGLSPSPLVTAPVPSSNVVDISASPLTMASPTPFLGTPEVVSEVEGTASSSPAFDGSPNTSAEAGLSPSPLFTTPVPSSNVVDISASPLTMASPTPFLGTPEVVSEVEGTASSSPAFDGSPNTSAEAGLSPSPLFTTPVPSSNVVDISASPLSSGTFISPILEATSEGPGEVGDTATASSTFDKVPIISAEGGLSPSPLFITPTVSANVGGVISSPSVSGTLPFAVPGSSLDILDGTGSPAFASPVFVENVSSSPEAESSMLPSFSNPSSSTHFETESPAPSLAALSPSSEMAGEPSSESMESTPTSSSHSEDPRSSPQIESPSLSTANGEESASPLESEIAPSYALESTAGSVGKPLDSNSPSPFEVFPSSSDEQEFNPYPHLSPPLETESGGVEGSPVWSGEIQPSPLVAVTPDSSLVGSLEPIYPYPSDAEGHSDFEGIYPSSQFVAPASAVVEETLSPTDDDFFGFASEDETVEPELVTGSGAPLDLPSSEPSSAFAEAEVSSFVTLSSPPSILEESQSPSFDVNTLPYPSSHVEASSDPAVSENPIFTISESPGSSVESEQPLFTAFESPGALSSNEVPEFQSDNSITPTVTPDGNNDMFEPIEPSLSAMSSPELAVSPTLVEEAAPPSTVSPMTSAEFSPEPSYAMSSGSSVNPSEALVAPPSGVALSPSPSITFDVIGAMSISVTPSMAPTYEVLSPEPSLPVPSLTVGSVTGSVSPSVALSVSPLSSSSASPSESTDSALSSPGTASSTPGAKTPSSGLGSLADPDSASGHGDKTDEPHGSGLPGGAGGISGIAIGSLVVILVVGSVVYKTCAVFPGGSGFTIGSIFGGSDEGDGKEGWTSGGGSELDDSPWDQVWRSASELPEKVVAAGEAAAALVGGEFAGLLKPGAARVRLPQVITRLAVPGMCMAFSQLSPGSSDVFSTMSGHSSESRSFRSSRFPSSQHNLIGGSANDGIDGSEEGGQSGVQRGGTPKVDLLFVFDASGSLSWRDYRRMKEILTRPGGLIDNIMKRAHTGSRIGFIEYAYDSVVVSELDRDEEAVRRRILSSFQGDANNWDKDGMYIYEVGEEVGGNALRKVDSLVGRSGGNRGQKNESVVTSEGDIEEPPTVQAKEVPPAMNGMSREAHLALKWSRFEMLPPVANRRIQEQLQNALRLRRIVVINAGELTEGGQAEHGIDAAMAEKREIERLGMRILTLGIGEEQERDLSKLATGKYHVSASSVEAVMALVPRLTEMILKMDPRYDGRLSRNALAIMKRKRKRRDRSAREKRQQAVYRAMQAGAIDPVKSISKGLPRRASELPPWFTQ